MWAVGEIFVRRRWWGDYKERGGERCGIVELVSEVRVSGTYCGWSGFFK